MATVHNTTLTPSKLELLAVWMPKQPWFLGSGAPELATAGGFRLDDPAGEVGIEFMVVTDAASPRPTSYLVPMTYRADSPQDAGGALIGTMEHGVLGKRYAYDGAHDPVLCKQLTALVRGEAQPQARSESATPEPTVQVGVAPQAGTICVVRLLTAADADPAPGEVVVPWRLPDGTEVRGVVARAS
jgi:hypothetical protein